MLNLNQQLKRVEIKEFEIENQIVFNYFDNLSVNERDEKLLRAIYIGVLALMEDRISSFLSKTSNELGTELESLKMIFDMKKELFYKSNIKGTLAEEEIAEYLNEHFQQKKIKDKAYLTGNSAGNLSRNKTGDILCEIDNNPNLKIAIECKFDKSIKFGEIENKDVFTRKAETAWSQLIESQANRGTNTAIIARALVATHQEYLDCDKSRAIEATSCRSQALLKSVGVNRLSGRKSQHQSKHNGENY